MSRPTNEPSAMQKIIDRVREEDGVSLRKLAKKAGLSAPHLSSLCNGNATMTINSIRRVVRAAEATEEECEALLDEWPRVGEMCEGDDCRQELISLIVKDVLTEGPKP